MTRERQEHRGVFSFLFPRRRRRAIGEDPLEGLDIEGLDKIEEITEEFNRPNQAIYTPESGPKTAREKPKGPKPL